MKWIENQAVYFLALICPVGRWQKLVEGATAENADAGNAGGVQNNRLIALIR
jgi:hypothetical protein